LLQLSIEFFWLQVRKLVYSGCELVFKLVLSAVVYYVIAVLFGAPFIQ